MVDVKQTVADVVRQRSRPEARLVFALLDAYHDSDSEAALIALAKQHLDAAVARHRLASTAALTAQRDALAAIVEKYARHDGLCGIIGGYGYCTCGLDAARKALHDQTQAVAPLSTNT